MDQRQRDGKEALARLIDLLRRVASPAFDPNRRNIVYILPQIDRIGQLMSECMCLFTRFDPAEHRIILVVPPVTPSMRVNAAAIHVLSRYAVFVPWSGDDLTEFGMYDLGEFEDGGVLYVLISPETTQNEFQLLRRQGRQPHRLELTEDEERHGQALRRVLGIDPAAPIVTLHVREPGYLPFHVHHSYRDADIDNYLSLIAWLLSNGHVVVRIGDPSMSRLRLEHPNLVDAPFHRQYQAFFDIYFIAKSRIFVGQSSGPQAIAQAFNTPGLYVNDPVQTVLIINDNDLYVFKKYMAHRLGRILSYEEISCSNLCDYFLTEKFDGAGVTLVENTPEEITQAYMEQHLRLEGRYKPNPTVDAALRRVNLVAETFRRVHGPQLGLKSVWPLGFGEPRISHEFVALNPGFLPGTRLLGDVRPR